jgi:hypothetical protein
MAFMSVCSFYWRDKMLSLQNVKKMNGEKAWSMHVSRFHPSALFSRFEALHIRKRLEHALVGYPQPIGVFLPVMQQFPSSQHEMLPSVPDWRKHAAIAIRSFVQAHAGLNLQV